MQIFLFHPVNPEGEINILFLDHRLRDVDQVLNRFLDGKRQRRQFQLSAFNLGDIKNIIDQGQQMISGKPDLPDALPC